jgi:hypothetical protein
VNHLIDFNLQALYIAIDEQRQARGLTWRQVAREMNPRVARVPVRASSCSIVTSLRTKTIAEGDSVLQMLRWLNRAPESFVADQRHSSGAVDLPDAPSHQILRFDTAKLYAAIDAHRIGRGLTWDEAADQIGGIAAVNLLHLKKGGRTGFPYVMRIVRWLGLPAAHFVCASDA